MAKIPGTPTVTPAPKPDWNQTDPTKADYIKNKPKAIGNVYVGTGEMPPDCNVQIDPDGVVTDLPTEIKNATKEEWITIADDAKLTEDVASLEFTTDTNGNPFVCKEIIVMVLMNATGVIGTKYYFGINTNSIYAQVRDQYGFVIRSTANGMFQRHETHDYSGWVHYTNYGCTTNRSEKLFDKYCLLMPIDVPFKAGTRFWVWGLKA